MKTIARHLDAKRQHPDKAKEYWSGIIADEKKRLDAAGLSEAEINRQLTDFHYAIALELWADPELPRTSNR